MSLGVILVVGVDVMGHSLAMPGIVVKQTPVG